jgi:altronate dehydratase small subunit
MTDPTTDPRLILLDARDNVLVARAAIAQGVTLLIDGQPCTLNTTVSMGHKLARHPIASGDKIIKYGAPIGSATAAISPACHVHLHNMKSNYTATHSLDAARSTYGAAT